MKVKVIYLPKSNGYICSYVAINMYVKTHTSVLTSLVE